MELDGLQDGLPVVFIGQTAGTYNLKCIKKNKGCYQNTHIFENLIHHTSVFEIGDTKGSTAKKIYVELSTLSRSTKVQSRIQVRMDERELLESCRTTRSRL